MKQKEIALLGKITAGITHEMKNVLATIHESSGLMEDLLAASEHTQFPRRETFTRALGSLQKQVQRGVSIITGLNTFAHKMDHEDASILIGNAIELACFLTNRFAHQKQVLLSVSPPDNAPSINTKPFRLILALIACIDACLQILPPHSTLSIRAECIPGNTEFLMSGELPAHTEPSPPPPPCPVPDLDDFISITGAQLSPFSEPGKTGLKMLLPLTRY
jgi:C4-dicarboxylate-specific signal transduction histidine kinase